MSQWQTAPVLNTQQGIAAATDKMQNSHQLGNYLPSQYFIQWLWKKGSNFHQGPIFTRHGTGHNPTGRSERADPLTLKTGPRIQYHGKRKKTHNIPPWYQQQLLSLITTLSSQNQKIWMQPQNWTALNTVAFTPLAFQDFVPSNISKSGSSNIQHFFGTIQWGCQQKALVLLEQFKQASGKNCMLFCRELQVSGLFFFFSPGTQYEVTKRLC